MPSVTAGRLGPAGEPRRRRPEDYDGVYEGRPRWDIGRPQPALLDVARRGGLQGHVLDVGCGTGEHALMAATMGHVATGIDTSAQAIEIAVAKARRRRLRARFVVCDATELRTLDGTFDTVVDSGLFHVLGDGDRARFVEAVTAVVRSGGRYLLLCFSDQQPGDDGPRRIAADDIIATFRDGWRVDAIEATRIDTIDAPASVAAWLASLTRLD
jgi:cyclopropane fatty-acyl-phospholipid synthase-like methyltransferase